MDAETLISNMGRVADGIEREWERTQQVAALLVAELGPDVARHVNAVALVTDWRTEGLSFEDIIEGLPRLAVAVTRIDGWNHGG